MSRIGLIPPAGVPFPFHFLSSALKQSTNKTTTLLLKEFTNEFFTMFKSNPVILAGSGTECLEKILLRMAQIQPERKQVIVCDYTCPTVIKAVKNAGLQVKQCPINYDDFSLDLELLIHLIDRRTLAFIDQHLFGFPVDLHAKRQVADQMGIYFIEDCAQCMSVSENFQVGHYGHFAFYSFGFDKVITCGNGGLATTDDKDFISFFSNDLDMQVKANFWKSITDFMELLVYRLFLSMISWGLLENLHLRPKSVSHVINKKSKWSKFQLAFITILIHWIPELRSERQQNAEKIVLQLEKSGSYFIPENVTRTLRFADAIRVPLVFNNLKAAQNAKTKFKKNGISTTLMYENMSQGHFILGLPTLYKINTSLEKILK